MISAIPRPMPTAASAPLGSDGLERMVLALQPPVGVTIPLEWFLIGAAVILLVAFGPPILFAASVARAKRYRREPTHAIRAAFLWGALGAAAIALILNTTIGGGLVRPYLRHDGLVALVGAVVVAPLVEEAAKPLAMSFGSTKRHCDEVVDGIIYGAVAGLGFSATENLLYELAALSTAGGVGYIYTAVARTFSSSLLHATATAITGYGIGRYYAGKGGWGGIFGFFLLAVLLHAGFNLIATAGLLFGFLALFAVAIIGFSKVKSRITELSLVAPVDTWHAVGEHRSLQHGHEAPVENRGHGPEREDRQDGWVQGHVPMREADGRWRDHDDPDRPRAPRSDPSFPAQHREARQSRTWQPVEED